MSYQISRADLDYMADRIADRIEAKNNLPEWISCKWACELLGPEGKPISQQALKRKLDKMGVKSERMGKGHGIQSAWIPKLRHY